MKRKRMGLVLLALLILGCAGTTRKASDDDMPQEAGIPKWALAIGCSACPFFVGTTIGATFLVVLLSRGRRDSRTVQISHPAPRRRTAERGDSRDLPASLCPECGIGLPADAPEGLCPQCLLKGVISSAHDAVKAAPAEQTAAAGTSAAPLVEELAPLLPQLEIIELIGQGGMGAVYKARQPSLDRLVAVKVLPPEAGRDPAFAERFNREARALARLSHPNIVAVHDVGKAGDVYYIVMEYVEGVNLRQVLRDGQLRPEQALQIVPQICDALQYAHEEGVVHRDIKPENILLDRKGRVKIADFGLVKLLGRDTADFALTGSRQVMGTLYYMAPEQVERPLEVDHRADIYSLGVVFYEMLTGQLPVGRFLMPSEKAGTDAFLDEVVLHALEREPAQRYQHASEVKTDVESHSRRSPVSAREASGADRELALHQLRGPANGLMVMGVLGPLGWLVALLIYALILYADKRGYMPQFQFDLERSYVPFVTFCLLNAVVGGFLIVGARKMKRLEAYELSVITSLSVVLQIATPTFPISFIVGGWALWVLRKPEVKAAFADELRRRARVPAEAEKPSPSAVQVRWPALGLLLVGILQTALPLMGGLVGLMTADPWRQSRVSPPPGNIALASAGMADFGGRLFAEVGDRLSPLEPNWSVLGPALVLLLSIPGALIIIGAVNMLRLGSRGWALTAAILALLPCGPGWPLGLPVGIWALAVLTAPDVKEAFGKHQRAT